MNEGLLHNGHISSEQLEQFSRQPDGSGELWSHIGNCSQCRTTLEKYRKLNAKLDKLVADGVRSKPTMNCPDERIWFDVAAGTLSPEESLNHAQHASTCDACGKKLKTAVRIFEPELSQEEERILDSLPSSRIGQQSELTSIPDQVGHAPQQKASPVRERPARTSWWKPFSYALSGFLMVVMVLAIKVYRDNKLDDRELVIQEYKKKGRPTEFRLADIPYSPTRSELGPADKHYISLSDRQKQPQLRAAVALLKLDSKTAIKILEEARNNGDTSRSVLDDLVVAYAVEAQRTASDKYLQDGLKLATSIISQYPDDSVAYFNRGLIYSNLRCKGCAQKALADFERVVQLKGDPNWVQEAQKKLR